MKSEGVGLVVGYLYFSQAQDLDLSPDSLEWNWSCGNFLTICKDFVSLQMVGKFPQTQFCFSINILLAAPLLSCLLSVQEERLEIEATFGSMPKKRKCSKVPRIVQNAQN